MKRKALLFLIIGTLGTSRVVFMITITIVIMIYRQRDREY